MVDINISNIDGLEYLATINNNSINLILTDPPYIISKDTGMNNLYNSVKFNEDNNIEFIKSEEEWENYKKKNNIDNDTNKSNYLNMDLYMVKNILSKPNMEIGILNLL